VSDERRGQETEKPRREVIGIGVLVGPVTAGASEYETLINSERKASVVDEVVVMDVRADVTGLFVMLVV
jgi:hypothetical protein